MPTTSNFGWTTPADTDLVKDGAAAIRTLGNGIDASLVDLKGGTTGQVLSKNSNTDLDFTWVAQDDSDAIQNALLTTTGDTIYASGASTPARLGIGTTGQVLTVSGGVPVWSTPAGFSLISEQTASAVTSLSFSSIPSTYKALIFTWQGIYHSTTGSGFGLRLNNDSASNYAVNGHKIFNYTNQTSEADTTHLGASDVFAFGVNITASTNRVRSAKGTLIIYDYASTSKLKYCRLQTSHFEGTGGGTNHLDVDIIYNSTSAISSIDIFRNTGSASFSNMTNTSIRLYGLS